MECGGLWGDSLSPESTVTSLLSKSGHLRSSLRPPQHSSTFRYKDKEYDSASATLDAYIADFERSRESSESSLTGKLLLPHSPPSTPCRHRVGTLRNKDVLRERLTDRELDFLNLPVSVLHHRAYRDRLSMTTDELLSIPYDGSMPVTHTTALIQDFLSRSAASQPCPSSSSRLLHHHSLPHRTSRSARCRDRPRATAFNPGLHSDSFKRSEQAPPSSSLHLPRWFTSNKADMDCSGITSVPDLKYPAWLQRCDLSEPPPPQSELWDDHDVLPPGAPRTTAPSWVADMEKDEEADQTPAQSEEELHWSSLEVKERKSSDVVMNMYQDNRIESLIQKADQVLNSLSQSSGQAECPADPVSPVNTEELLHHSPSHCPLDSAAGGFTEELTNTGAEGWSHENSIWKQPGPVEALKQMLFRLQAVEAELQRQQQGTPAAFAFSEQQQMPAKQWPGDDAELQELQSFPGRPSLERALHHLNRLKMLVEEPREKSREEEKDDDEGRYSSSSADRLVCSQQEPSGN
ncbi:lung adenoma susceptibility protein 2 isoform X2 [Archocentrus centrarchus]|uniref:lung adenoma susceptibility protein 2 isoform X2 n=1 Tax=Archocentrus centrarchus TaxID=63155 RepID=UPI0011EA2D12|nr:lung adenoma susceptibility protein 2 isoform X2 [Archocentrus centrarchus]